MNSKFVFVNGDIVPYEQASLHVADLAIQRGYGIFDFLKTIDNHPVFIDDYLNRFFNSAKEMHLEIPYDKLAIKTYVKQLIRANQLPNSGIKLILTGGYSADGYSIAEKPNLIMLQSALNLSPDTFEKGLRLATSNYQRQIPSVKTIDYIHAILLHGELLDRQADDLLYHNEQEVRECPRANIFMVKNGQVFTPKSAILRGITRSKILGFSTKDLPIVERDFSLNELYEADEAFVSVTTKNICPVLQIDHKPIHQGNIGYITRQLSQQLLDLIKSDIEKSQKFNSV
jgi:D-alanine transaminase/branched-chain amino acid aminotransferase